jgi:hypothetical protein
VIEIFGKFVEKLNIKVIQIILLNSESVEKITENLI